VDFSEKTTETSFHSTKEGFKAAAHRRGLSLERSFHSTKEGFKVQQRGVG